MGEFASLEEDMLHVFEVPEDYELYEFCKEVLGTTKLYGKEL